jgi:hypothetical protein
MQAILNIGESMGALPLSDFDLAEIIEKGLPVERLSLLKQKGLTFSELGAVVISPRTLKHRKARGENLSHEESDRAIRVERVIALADQVFGDHAKAMLWLRSADESIGGRDPLGMLRTEAGGRVVESMLWQIDEGVYS